MMTPLAFSRRTRSGLRRLTEATSDPMLGHLRPQQRVPMNFVFQPWQLFHLILASWANQDLRQAIDYLRTENQILREIIGKKRILLDDHNAAAWPSKAKSWDA